MTGSKTRSTLVKRIAWRAATDERFRERLVSAIAAGIVARRRARRRRERLARVLTTDLDLRRQVEELAAHARRLQRRSEPKHHGVRNFALFVVGVGMVAAAAPVVRRRMRGGDEAPHDTSAATFDANGSTTLVEEIEVAVPVSAAYSQWTQFEEFPKFMEGVDEVTQLDDSLLHGPSRWPASTPNGMRGSSSASPTARLRGSRSTDACPVARSRSSPRARRRRASG